MLFHLFYRTFFILLFFFTDTATTEIYTLSLHDALPILVRVSELRRVRIPLPVVDKHLGREIGVLVELGVPFPDRKSTRLNSSHLGISYAVFCLKKKKKKK